MTIRTYLFYDTAPVGVEIKIFAPSYFGIENVRPKEYYLKKLKEIGAAMELKLVYGFVPKRTLQK